MLKLGFLLLQVSHGRVARTTTPGPGGIPIPVPVPDPMPGYGQSPPEVPVPQPILQQPVTSSRGGIPIPVTVPTPFPVPVPVIVTVPMPVPVPVPIPVAMSQESHGDFPGAGDFSDPHTDASQFEGTDEQLKQAASCEAHPDCAKHVGLCCPAEDGKMMPCCSSVMDHWVADHKYIITLVDGASVRKEATATSEEVTKYEYGKTFDVQDVKKDEKGDEWLMTSDGWLLSVCEATGEHVADHVLPPEPEIHIVTAPKGLTVREGLDKTSNRVDVVKRGGEFHVLERAFSEAGELRLRIGPNRWVSETCSRTGTRISEPVNPKDEEHYKVTSSEDVTLYTGSDLATKAEATLKSGQEVNVIGRTVDDNKNLILRTSQGWFPEKSEGVAVVERTLASKAPKEVPTPDADAEATTTVAPDPAAGQAKEDATEDASKAAAEDAAKAEL